MGRGRDFHHRIVYQIMVGSSVMEMKKIYILVQEKKEGERRIVVGIEAGLLQQAAALLGAKLARNEPPYTLCFTTEDLRKDQNWEETELPEGAQYRQFKRKDCGLTIHFGEGELVKIPEDWRIEEFDVITE